MCQCDNHLLILLFIVFNHFQTHPSLCQIQMEMGTGLGFCGGIRLTTDADKLKTNIREDKFLLG